MSDLTYMTRLRLLVLSFAASCSIFMGAGFAETRKFLFCDQRDDCRRRAQRRLKCVAKVADGEDAALEYGGMFDPLPSHPSKQPLKGSAPLPESALKDDGEEEKSAERNKSLLRSSQTAIAC